MQTPNHNPTIAILAPIPVEVLQEILDREDYPLPGLTVVAGTGNYNALADYQPGPPHGDEEERIAQELSQRFEGICFVLSFEAEPQLETQFEHGTKRYDGVGDPETIAHQLGLSGLLPPPFEIPRNFVLVEGASIAQVANALDTPIPEPGAKLHLEKRPSGILGWIDGGVLGIRARKISKTLSARVYSIADEPESFRVRLIENGEETAALEQPPSMWSEGLRVESLLGCSTRDEFLRVVGILQ